MHTDHYAGIHFEGVAIKATVLKVNFSNLVIHAGKHALATELPKGTAMYSCRKCNYNICSKRCAEIASFVADYQGGKVAGDVYDSDSQKLVYKGVPDTGSLGRLIQTGHLRLLRGRWLVELDAKKGKLVRSQDLPDAAFWPAGEALDKWRKHGEFFFLALSYGWIAPCDPDPDSFQLPRFASIIDVRIRWAAQCPDGRGGPFDDVALFWDFASLPQVPRTPFEDAVFGQVLQNMHLIYAHQRTTVLRMVLLPKGVRELDFRGWPLFEQAAAWTKGTMYTFYEFDGEFDVAVARAEVDRIDEWPPFSKWEGNKQPPLTPAAFDVAIRQRHFTGRGDMAKVSELYLSLWRHTTQAEELNFGNMFEWGKEEAALLADALRTGEFRRLKDLWLQNCRKLGDEGVLAVCAALRHAPALDELVLTKTGCRSSGARGVAAALRDGDLPNLTLLYLEKNPGIGKGAKAELRAAWAGAGKDAGRLLLAH